MIQIVTGASFASADKPTNSRAYDGPSRRRISCWEHGSNIRAIVGNHTLQDASSHETYHRRPPSQLRGEGRGGHRDARRFVLKTDPIAEEFEDLQMSKLQSIGGTPWALQGAGEIGLLVRSVQSTFESSA